MYKVYCDKWLLYDGSTEELKIINPKLDLEVNKTGSFTFTIYPYHPYYKMQKKLKSIVTVYQKKEVIFRGRILNDEKGFRNEKQVTCEGELAFLLDSKQRPYKFQGDIPELFQRFIDNHNAQVEEEKRFKVGKVTVKDANGYINRSDTQYLSTYDSIFKKLIDTHGGYLNFRHEADGVYIDYLEDFTRLNSQDIELCKNILDLKEITKGEDIATAIIPLGAKIKNEADTKAEAEEEKRLTIESVNDGKDYVFNEEAVEKFGWIFKTITWDDVTLPENLLKKANEELANAFSFVKSLEISAVDLSGTDNKISSFRVGTYNNVKSPLHDIEELLLVTKLSINLANPKSDKMTLGKTFKSLTDQNNEGSDIFGDIIDRVDKVEGDYNVNKPIIEEILNKLTLDLKRNHTMLQNYNPTHGIFIPDYTKEPLVITPTAIYRGKEVTCSYVWKRIIDGIEKPLEGWEGVGADGKLTIRRNMADRSAIYKCYATYRKGTTTLVANETIDFNRVDDGIDGLQGEKGEQGIPGKDGADGKTSYTHIAYANSADGTKDFSVSDSNREYIGMYVDFAEPDSTTPSKYAWSKIKGQDGANGIPGKPGADGRTPYFHVAYANSADGKLGFSTTNSVNKLYIGQYTDFVKEDSTDPTKYAWTKIKGEDGADGKDAAIQSPTPPEDKTQLWLDTSLTPPLLKQWNGTEWIVVNDTSEEIKSLREELKSEISQTSKDIKFEVEENYYQKGETDSLVSSVSTKLEQTKDEFNFTFNKFNQDLEDLENGTNAEFKKIEKYIRFVDGNIILGEVGNELVLKLQHDRISFLQNNAEVAYFTNKKLYVTDGEYTNSLTLGNFAFIPRENGNLSFKKVR